MCLTIASSLNSNLDDMTGAPVVLTQGLDELRIVVGRISKLVIDVHYCEWDVAYEGLEVQFVKKYTTVDPTGNGNDEGGRCPTYHPRALREDVG